MSASASTKPARPGTWQVLFPFVLATVETLIVYRGLNTYAPHGPLSLTVAIVAVLFGASAIVAAFWVRTLPYWGIVVLMLGGIALGIFIDVLVDAFLFSVDRNLFPIEIAFAWVVSFVPLAIGAFIGRLLHTEWQGAGVMLDSLSNISLNPDRSPAALARRPLGAGQLWPLGVQVFDDLSQVLTRVAGGAVGAIVPAFFARGVVKRICEFKPRWVDTYIGFTVGSLAAIAWERVVLTLRDSFFPTGLGLAYVLGWLFTWTGALALIILSVAYFVRDKERRPIGLGSGVIVTLLTCLVSAPIAFILWLILAFTFMPKLSY